MIIDGGYSDSKALLLGPGRIPFPRHGLIRTMDLQHGDRPSDGEILAENYVILEKLDEDGHVFKALDRRGRRVVALGSSRRRPGMTPRRRRRTGERCRRPAD